MRNEPAALDGEDEPRRRLLGPAANHVGRGQTIKGGVNLDARELAGVKGQTPGRCEILRIERPGPTFINPAARPYKQLAHGAAYHRGTGKGMRANPNGRRFSRLSLWGLPGEKGYGAGKPRQPAGW